MKETDSGAIAIQLLRELFDKGYLVHLDDTSGSYHKEMVFDVPVLESLSPGNDSTTAFDVIGEFLDNLEDQAIEDDDFDPGEFEY